MAIEDDDILLLLAELNPPNHSTLVGGANSQFQIDSSDVADVFMPGVIYPSDFSDTLYQQYRKVFLYNNSYEDSAINAKVYGYNLKRNSIVKFAIEKNNSGITVDGDETTQDALTAPTLFGEYDWTEVHSDGALLFKNEWEPRTAQGIWLRMQLSETRNPDDFDQFIIGVKTD